MNSDICEYSIMIAHWSYGEGQKCAQCFMITKKLSRV